MECERFQCSALIGSAALHCGHWKLRPTLCCCCCRSCCCSPRCAVCCHGDHGHAGPNKATGNICIITTSAHKEVHVIAAAHVYKMLPGAPLVTPSFTFSVALMLSCCRGRRLLALKSTMSRTKLIRLTFWPPACNQCFCQRGESQSPWWLRVWNKRQSQTLWRWARWSTAEPQLDPKDIKINRQLQHWGFSHMKTT